MDAVSFHCIDIVFSFKYALWLTREVVKVLSEKGHTVQALVRDPTKVWAYWPKNVSLCHY
jgi:hypothetical protein